MTSARWLTNLGRVAERVLDEARVAVVLDVVALDEVLEVVERLVGPVDELDHTHLHDVNLHNTCTHALACDVRASHKFGCQQETSHLGG